MKKVTLVLMSFLGALLSSCTDHLVDPIFSEVQAWKAGGPGFDGGQSIAADANGNVYVTGSFQGTATFGTTTLTSTGAYDLFVVKYTTNGEVLWAKKAGGGGDDVAYGIALDGTGNVYVTGYFAGAATFGDATLSAAGIADAFIAKYTNDGEIQWVRSAIGTSEGHAVAVDGSGNIYVTGTFLGTTTFGTIPLSSSLNDVFIVKYNSEGEVQWAKKAGGATSSGRGIAVGASGQVLITGIFSGMATFGTLTLTSSGEADVFVAQYSANGEVQWAQKAGGGQEDVGESISVDGSGNVYVTGFFKNAAAFGPLTLMSTGDIDAFITKYSSSGELQWARNAGDAGTGIVADGSGNVYVTGTFSGNAILGTTTLTSSGSSDVLIAKYSSSGEVQWAKKGGGPSSDTGFGIAVDGSGKVYVTGYFIGTATFGRTLLTSNGNSLDVFVAKYPN
jgi:hypothetical protein